MPARLRGSLGTRAAFGAGLVSLAGVVAATAAARHAGPVGTPVVPPGGWRPLWWVGVIVSFAAYAVAVLLLAVSPTGGRRNAFVLACAIQAVPLATPLLLSTDANAYAFFAGLSDPYARGQSVYGPLWTAFSRVAVWIGHPATVFRLVAFASVLAITAMVSRLSRRTTLAAAFVGWNPMVAFHFSSAGHNDAVMTAFVVGGMTLAAVGRAELAGAAWVTSLFVKWTTAPLFLLWAIDRRRRGRPIGIAGAVAVALASLATAYWLFAAHWLDAFSNLQLVDRHPSSFFLAWIRSLTGISYGHERKLSFVATVVAFLFFARQAWRSRLHLGLAAGVLLLLAPHINAWYLILPLALAAADDEDRWGKVLALTLSGIILTDVLTPIPD